jgi:hypothetical protein
MGVFLERLSQSPVANDWTAERRRSWWQRIGPGLTVSGPRASRRTEATIRIDLSLRADGTEVVPGPGTDPDPSL